MTDDEKIMEERGKIYGDPKFLYGSFGTAIANLVRMAYISKTDNITLGLMVMAELKILRTMASKTHQDNYVDGRNYFTLCQRVNDQRISNRRTKNKKVKKNNRKITRRTK